MMVMFVRGWQSALWACRLIHRPIWLIRGKVSTKTTLVAFAKYCEANRPADAPVTQGNGSLMLMCRPKAIEALARAHEKAEAAAKLERLQGWVRGGIEGVPNSGHPSALAHNKITREIERLPIPGNREPE
jgi:hypothetical protein